MIIRPLGVLWLSLAGVICFQTGAPERICDSMLPSHSNFRPLQSPPPYLVTAKSIPDKGVHTQFWNVSVSSQDGTFFKGFMLQARLNPDTLPTGGQFTNVPYNSQSKMCNDKTNVYVTHVDNSPKETVSFEWESPAEYEGDITFISTVVQSYNTTWSGIRSNPIRIAKRAAEIHNTHVTIPQFEKEAYEGCDLKKRCLGSTPGCIKNRNCTAFVSVMPINSKYMFEMFSKGTKYVAVGLSEDNIMGGDGDSVLECVIGNSSTFPIQAYRSYNQPYLKQNKRLDISDQKQFVLERGHYENDAIHCKVLQESLLETENRRFDLDRTEYYLLLAAGTSLRENGVSYHDRVYVVSPGKARLEDASPPVIRNPVYDGCNTLKNCFGTPDGCVATQNCQAAVSILVQGSNYEFELIGKTSGFVAVGLSQDSKMGGDSVVECVNSDSGSSYSNVKAFMSWNIPNMKSNTREGVRQDGIQLLNGTYVDGALYCKFTRLERTMIKEQLFDLKNEQYFVLLAAGSQARANGVGYHDIVFTATSQKRLLSDVSTFSEASKLLLRLHGSFMIIAWLGCASTGIILARYFKQTWVGKSLCGKDLWFAWHRMFMLITWCLTIVAFILIFVEIGEWVEGGSQLHAILGCVTTIFAFIQPIGAAFRPAPNAHNRPIFNWFHWFFGNTAYIFGMATIFLAVPLSKAELPEWFNWMIVPHVALYVITHFLLSINQCCSNKSTSKIETVAMKDMHPSGSPQPLPDRRTDAPNTGFRKALFTLFFIGNVLLVAAIVVVVALAPVEEKWKMLSKGSTK